MKYRDSDEFRRALDEKLRQQAQQNGRNQDYIRLQEELAIERFMARIDPDVAMVKGGAATMFTIPNAPHTRDVDLIVSKNVVTSLGLDKMQPDERTDALTELVEDQLRSGPKGDFFRFKLEDSFPITDLKPGHACARVNISVMVGKTDFYFLQLDIALQDGDVPSKMQPGRDLLNFAEVANPNVRTVTPEYLVADKVTLYLEEHGQPDANRVKDIVHAALLIERSPLDKDKLTHLLASRASHREVVHKLKDPIPDPPEHWKDRFDELMEPTNSNMTITEAMDVIRKTIHPLCPLVLDRIEKTKGRDENPSKSNQPKVKVESDKGTIADLQE